MCHLNQCTTIAQTLFLGQGISGKHLPFVRLARNVMFQGRCSQRSIHKLGDRDLSTYRDQIR